MSTRENAAPYLEYLEKEMTIVGLLSTFCVAVVGLAFQQVLGAKLEEPSVATTIYSGGREPMFAASFWMLMSAFYFYRQRSRLAWVYGQICLSIAKESDGTNDWLEEADSWPTWTHYHAAFSFMGLAFAYYAIAASALQTAVFATWMRNHLLTSILAPTAAIVVVLVFRECVFRTHPRADHPFKRFLGLDKRAK